MTGTSENVFAVILVATIVISVFGMSAAFAGNVAAEDSTITVSDGGDELQSAISDAEEGDVIKVTDSETYNQTVIDRSSDVDNLTIRAADGALPTISHDASNGEPTIAIDQDNITLEGFIINRTNSDSRSAQTVRVAGDNVTLIDNRYKLDSSENDAAVSVQTDSSGAAENPTFDGTISNVTISGGEIITENDSQSSVVVSDGGSASFGGDESVTVSDVEFTANADSTHVLELDTGSGVVNITEALSDNNFDTAAASDDTDGSIADVDVDGVISSTIQGAVDNAAKDSTVEVGPGTYEESVSIGTQNVTLEGPNTGVPGYSEERSPEANISNDDGGSTIVTVQASNVTIDGLQIDGPARKGIDIDNTNDVSDLTINNTQITNIHSTFSGQNYSDGRAIAAYLDGDGNASNITIENVLIDGVSNDEGGDERARGVSINTQGTDVTDLTVRDNVITDLETSGSDSGKADGVQLNVEQDSDPGDDPGNLTGATIEGNTIENLTANKATGIRLAEDGDVDPAVGPKNFTITENTISDITGDTDENSLAVGGYSNLGSDYEIRRNDFSGGMVAYYEDEGPRLDAPLNWWGESDGVTGPNAVEDTNVTDNVNYLPFLTTPVEDLEVDDAWETTQFATDLVARNDTATTVGFPGPTDQTVGEAFGDFEGAVYEWDGDGWSSIENGDREIGTLEAFVVLSTDGDVVVNVEYADVEPTTPGETTLEQGFNFVAPATEGPADGSDTLGLQDRETLYHLYEEPLWHPASNELDRGASSTPGDDQVSPFMGYFVHVADGDRSHNAIVTRGVEAHELFDDLNLSDE